MDHPALASTSASSEWPVTGRAAWIAGLVGVYVLVSVLGWHRTLINDEIWYLVNAALPLTEYLETLRLDLTHPPLMYLLERLAMDAFGHSDAVVKGLVVLLGALSISAFVVLSSLVVPRWRLCSALFCSAYLQVGGVPNLARGYSFGLLLTVVALLVWELWRRRPRPGLLAVWAAVMVALVYTHYVGLLLLGPFAVVNWWYGHRRWVFALTACAIGLAFLPWFVVVFPVYQSRGLDQNLGWIHLTPLQILATLPFHLLSYLPAGWNPLGENDWPRSLEGKRVLVVAALAVHAILAVLAFSRARQYWPPWKPRDTTGVWLWSTLLLMTAPVAALFAFSVIVSPAFDARFVAFVLPMYWLLMTLAAGFGGPAARGVIVAVVVPWLVVSVSVPLVRALRGEGLYRSVAVVDRELAPGDMVLAERLAAPQLYWEWTRRFRRNEPIVIISAQPRGSTPRVMPSTRLEHLNLDNVDRVWFFSTPHNPDNVADIKALAIDRGFREASPPSWPDRPYVTLFQRR